MGHGDHVMSQHWSHGLRAIAATNGACPQPLKRALRAMNALAESLLVARARDEDPWLRALPVSQLASLGLSRDDCRELMALGLAACDGNASASSLIVLTDAGLAMLKHAIPFGAVRPIYAPDARTLIVAGETILPLAVQARNLAAFLSTIEEREWAPRIEKPLGRRPCGNDRNRVAVAAHTLNGLQQLIDFHADDGAATWNWRPAVASGRRRPVRRN